MPNNYRREEDIPEWVGVEPFCGFLTILSTLELFQGGRKRCSTVVALRGTKAKREAQRRRKRREREEKRKKGGGR